MNKVRASGILLHPTSLPGPYGIGDLGKEAYHFVDCLAKAGQRYWQVLPFGPTGYGDSPYQSFSAFAGNPLLIDLEDLLQKKLLQPEDLQPVPDFPSDKVDYGWVIYYKYPLLKKSFENFKNNGSPEIRQAFLVFCEQHWFWLDDYALFIALRDLNDGKIWNRWEKDIANREVDASIYFADKLEYEIEEQKFWQFLFFEQWKRLKRYSHQKGLRIIGDIPLYMAYDSADVWAHREFFDLDENGNVRMVAGVPPDYFSPSGQRWGNPVYRWEKLSNKGYQWWVDRFRVLSSMVDIVRLDHFRGFESYWEIPAENKTAEHGRWIKGPGADFFRTVFEELPRLLIFVENLGLITPEVELLRNQFQLAGMAVFQYGFGSSQKTNPHLPHNFEKNQVVYSGTHDNETIAGWFSPDSGCSVAEKRQKQVALQYIHSKGNRVHWDVIRSLLGSVAEMAIFPLQDILGLSNEARMNHPGVSNKNWQWRYRKEMLEPGIIEELRHLSEIYGRVIPLEDKK